MGARPSGTVTFLFTDIEGSTRLWETGPAGMRVALAAMTRWCGPRWRPRRVCVLDRGGRVGGGVRPGRGGGRRRGRRPAGVGGGPWPAGVPLRVRMGLHTGEAEERDGDYFGPAVNRAARVMAVGHGGQVLLAAVTAGLVDGVDLVDLGEHRLRDLSGPSRCSRSAPGLAASSRRCGRDAVPGNLPVLAPVSWAARQEVARLAALVRAHRLVTLTGVGGVGKTRLALQVAAELAAGSRTGCGCGAGPGGRPGRGAEVVAAALGVTARPDDGGRQYRRRSCGAALLVVLDNCEHVLDAAAGWSRPILARAARVRVMATSREGLRVGAEQLWPVPSLGVDGRGVGGGGAVRGPGPGGNAGFSLDDQADVEAVVEICRRLDGIPLAIELAAARVASMSPQDGRDRLDERFRLLTGGRRGVERHQTLRHAVAWSYDLLDDDERTVLTRCAVFAGGFDLAAAAHLCAPAG